MPSNRRDVDSLRKPILADAHIEVCYLRIREFHNSERPYVLVIREIPAFGSAELGNCVGICMAAQGGADVGKCCFDSTDEVG